MPIPMPIPTFARALRRLLLPTLLLTAAPAALAQYPAGAVVQSLPQAGDPAELLATALRTLAVEPNNLAALTAAGHNALVLGDPNAAVGFFGRAQEIAPRDGHVKAGLGSALIELEKPQEALRLFADASRLGVPDDEIAEDRGLAYDLTGDPRKAQRDYAIVLAAHPEDDVVRRRLALSQGISGDKAAAIATLDPLIRKRDIAGWRAQTFVLAMNGDAKGASDITHIMLPQQADMLQPFLIRLATLSPADKARAVNFGEMPAAGRAYSPTELANTGTAPTYAASANAASTMPVTRAAPAPVARVATRASDLAPIPAAGARQVVTTAPSPTRTPLPAQVAIATPSVAPIVATPAPESAHTVTPRREITSRDEIFALGEPTYRYAPLAATALTPARAQTQTPASAVARGVPAPTPILAATVASPTPMPAATTEAVASTPAPAPSPPIQIAQVNPAPTTTNGPPAPELPTSAAVGHYDLPHDVAHPAAHMPSAPPPSVAAAKTIGTPVVHGEARSTPPEPKPAKLADDDAAPVASKRDARLARADTDDAAPRHHSGTPADKAADTDAPTTDRKGRKTAHGRSAAADAQDDQASDTGRKGKHARADSTDDGDSAVKTRKGAHGSRLAAADDVDDSSAKGRRGAHGKKAADDDSDAKSSRSSKSSKKDEQKPAPERVFVQVAGGANKDDMDKAWAGLKKKAPDLMKGHTPQTTPLHATNRLLVGPFKSEDEAQAFVNKMAGKGLSGFTVKTSKGQKVDKVDAGQ